MPRPAYNAEQTPDKKPKRTGRVPARLTPEQWDRLREMAIVWHRKPIEVLAGEWLGERIDAEYKKGKPRPAK
jgi:hypothetical protein